MTQTGDLNGDNFADIIIGAPGIKNGAGAVYVLFGKLRGFTNIHTGQISALDGCEIHGDSIGDHLGLSVSGAGNFMYFKCKIRCCLIFILRRCEWRWFR